MKRTARQKLKSDIQKFSADLKKISHNPKLLDEHSFLKKTSEDIKNLNNDALSLENYQIAVLVHHVLTTPIGAPFVANKTLLEAALSFDLQATDRSDLHRLLSNWNRYNSYFDNELFGIFENLKKN